MAVQILTSAATTLNPEATGTATPQFEAAPSRYLRHVHLLRGIAIILVIGAHCWPAFGWTKSQTAGVLLVFDNVTVLFMFISGLLFQHLSANFRYRAYLRHRLSIIVLPYMVVSIPAVLMAVFVTHRTDIWPWVYRMPAWEEILFFLLTGKHLAPLWFIPMMTLFIFAAPLFIWIDRKNLYPVLVPVTLALSVLLGRDSVPGLWNVFGKALFMLPAYLAGMFFSRHRAMLEAWSERNRGLLLATLVVLSFAILLQFFPARDLAILQKLVLAVLLLAALKQLRIPKLMEGALAKIADLSFAIYFVHGYVITASRISYATLLGDPTASSIFPPSLTGMVLDMIVVLTVSVGLVVVARGFLGRHSRMIIGA